MIALKKEKKIPIARFFRIKNEPSFSSEDWEDFKKNGFYVSL